MYDWEQCSSILKCLQFIAVFEHVNNVVVLLAKFWRLNDSYLTFFYFILSSYTMPSITYNDNKILKTTTNQFSVESRTDEVQQLCLLIFKLWGNYVWWHLGCAAIMSADIQVVRHLCRLTFLLWGNCLCWQLSFEAIMSAEIWSLRQLRRLIFLLWCN